LPVVFDSYEKADGTRKTEYGQYGPEFASGTDKHEDYEYVIRYDRGIEVDFVLASGSVPVNYDYTRLLVEHHTSQRKIENEDEKVAHKNNAVTENRRCFWDGGIIANTPLRDTVLEHRRYWHYVRKSNPPLLRACIVNVHPIRQDTLPSNYDALVDRKNDLTYHDRTLFDERMVTMLTDYLDIIDRLVKLAQANGVAKASLDEIFKEQALTRNFLTGKPGTYHDLVEDMVRMDLVFRIERKNDVHTISNKTFDFSDTTISQLIKDGYEETLDQGSKKMQQWDSERRANN
ncbi:MAG: hypothetical protein WB664_11490, partial [Nitrososphaeraceae archaeon]